MGVEVYEAKKIKIRLIVSNRSISFGHLRKHLLEKKHARYKMIQRTGLNFNCVSIIWPSLMFCYSVYTFGICQSLHLLRCGAETALLSSRLRLFNRSHDSDESHVIHLPSAYWEDTVFISLWSI